MQDAFVVHILQPVANLRNHALALIERQLRITPLNKFVDTLVHIFHSIGIIAFIIGTYLYDIR